MAGFHGGRNSKSSRSVGEDSCHRVLSSPGSVPQEPGENEESVFWVKKMDRVAQGYDQTLMLTGFAFANFGMVRESIKYFEAALKINHKNRASRFYLQKYGGKS